MGGMRPEIVPDAYGSEQAEVVSEVEAAFRKGNGRHDQIELASLSVSSTPTSEACNWRRSLFVWFVCISLMADGPQRARVPVPSTATLPSCLWSLWIFPSPPGSRPTSFCRDASSALRVNQWLN